MEDLDALLLDEPPGLGERLVGRGVGAALDDLDRVPADRPTSTPSLGSGPIGVAPCWMYGASAPATVAW